MNSKSHHHLARRIVYAALFAVFLANANAQQTIDIPILANAKIFAKFDDKLPAVANYYTKMSEQEVLSFYLQHYGDVISQERKRGRLTVRFLHQNQQIRVVISRQNKLTQVDLLLIAQ
jgi:hypothetical protein